MLYAADFRAMARNALKGHWLMAVIAGLIITLLGGGSSSGGPELTFSYQNNQPDVSLEVFGQTVGSATERYPGLAAFIAANLVVLVIAAIVLGIVFAVIRSTISVGYARFNLGLLDTGEADLNHMVAYFPWMKAAFCTHFLVELYTFLWTLLLVIPGIMAAYSYAMVDYILAERPDLSPGEAIELSKQMMAGNRWRLFCLEFSFIGWDILSVLTLGIGSLWLNPYRECAKAAFYRSLV